MRISIVDYAGHPFQAQLSRKLAERGHDVLHLYFGQAITPRGMLTPTAEDPAARPSHRRRPEVPGLLPLRQSDRDHTEREGDQKCDWNSGSDG